MTQQRTIGIIGASGAVGRTMTKQLDAWRLGQLRLGSRKIQSLWEFNAEQLGNRGQIVEVDIENTTTLERFCAGCHIVINCAGPSYYIMDRVAQAALSQGADYVDTCGNETIYEVLSEINLVQKKRVALLSAGFLPGLSGWLPRYLATRYFERCTRLQAYMGGLDYFTFTAASDYLLSLNEKNNGPLAAWLNGKMIANALTPQEEITLPFFPRRVYAYPYFSKEMQRLAKFLKLTEASCYSVFDGTHTLTALRRWNYIPDKKALTDAASELCRSAELDTIGKSPYQILLFQLEGEVGKQPLTKTLLFRGKNISFLTGLVAALTVRLLLSNKIAPGCYFTEEVLETDSTLEVLKGNIEINAIEIFDAGLINNNVTEEGRI